MKYFNKDWYKEMQVSGFLNFSETVEEWEEMLRESEKIGMDYKQSLREDAEEKKEDLLKFLPKSLHPYIHDNTINSEYPSEKLKKLMLEWTEDYEKRMDDLEQAYKDNYNSIKERLAQNVVQLYEYSLHDSQVTSVERRSKDTIIITLDCSGTFNEFDKLKVTFTGVSKCSIPENFEGAWWLCHEIDLAEDGVELGVLFDCPFEEVMICAKNVLLEIDN
ncbi:MULTISPECIES: DUF4085 family protein [Bacillus cereus group]|uniref:DUF4085 family protein n=2 Tax=Bacillus cereus group TaxID=86661 RepID=B7JRN5_BACC0|nr:MULTISPECIES: DUF4085 family protein [Bacillus cereus group]EDX59107.1 hypothetical protein BCW_2680 [Bacillus cereus W]ACK89691.1 hypothetical protein BCAH820_2774 [Bacillus cereus AH820]EEM59605.1 hypothetical protein bthur0007_25260 [Bacillus thuringiensis serovar monterrey BGSC 4AJ1]KAA0748981.1 DUF4085 family protein [Bacillus sp. AY1-10]MCU5696859.1 DUF4085 domain-containing protein [Bacillus cereus]